MATSGVGLACFANVSSTSGRHPPARLSPRAGFLEAEAQLSVMNAALLGEAVADSLLLLAQLLEPVMPVAHPEPAPVADLRGGLSKTARLGRRAGPHTQRTNCINVR